jgi:hypothetical protein
LSILDSLHDPDVHSQNSTLVIILLHVLKGNRKNLVAAPSGQRDLGGPLLAGNNIGYNDFKNKAVS